MNWVPARCMYHLECLTYLWNKYVNSRTLDLIEWCRDALGCRRSLYVFARKKFWFDLPLDSICDRMRLRQNISVFCGRPIDWQTDKLWNAKRQTKIYPRKHWHTKISMVVSLSIDLAITSMVALMYMQLATYSINCLNISRFEWLIWLRHLIYSRIVCISFFEFSTWLFLFFARSFPPCSFCLFSFGRTLFPDVVFEPATHEYQRVNRFELFRFQSFLSGWMCLSVP